MALSELDKAITEFNRPVDLHLHAFRIDPDALEAYDETTIEHLMAKLDISREQAVDMLSNVVNRGQEFGLNFNFEVARGGNTLNGHRLLKIAKAKGNQLSVALEIFKGHFELGKVPSDMEALEQIAMRAGLSQSAIDELLKSDKFTDDVLADEAEVVARGINSRPYFVLNGRTEFEGLKTKAEFLDLLMA
jgi:predicted DsbA family dithiol-disulfide isomerase